eukprot:Hpha_TRINITY_DN16517_c3_g6::TRINITY_DN16517_c3_g6_i1::g.133061::m.133061
MVIEAGCLRWLVREGDTKDEARIKTNMFPITLFFLGFGVFGNCVSLHNKDPLWYTLGGFSVIAGQLVFMIGVSTNALPAGYLLDALLVMSALGLCAIDIGNAAVTSPFRSWTFVILALDCALVFQRDHMPLFIIPFVLLCVSAEVVESVERFGLYETGYWGSAGVEVSYCDCASPPCGNSLGGAAITIFAVCLTFLGDFYFTRGFATGMRLQLRRVE